MPSSTLAKNLNPNLCFAKIKRPSVICAMPDDDHRRPPPSPSAATSPILYKNFNSLYDQEQVQVQPLDDDPGPQSSEPDFATVVASQRFFFASPGRSNSITESTAPSFSVSTNGSDGSTSTNDPDRRSVSRSRSVKDSVAVPTFSPDPFTDFRRSMQEMAEAFEVLDVESDWEYLHQLLMSYLALNPESLHEYIIGAFADLLNTLMSAKGGAGAKSTVVGDIVPGNACK